EAKLASLAASSAKAAGASTRGEPGEGQRVDPEIRAELGVEGGAQEPPRPHQDRLAAEAGQHLHAGPRRDDAGGADEEQRRGLAGLRPGRVGGRLEAVELTAPGVAPHSD